jgi:hypothetical protein
VLDIGPRIWDGKEEKKLIGFTVRIEAGAAAGNVGDFQHKSFTLDLVDLKLHRDRLQQRLSGRLGADNTKKLMAELDTIAKVAIENPGAMVEAFKAARARLPLLAQVYSSCTEEIENNGHRFGENLPETDKNALTAFLATL